MPYQTRPTCDSYFVESHEERARAIREQEREHEKYYKRQTQKAIGQNLSDMDNEAYGADILSHMEKMEVRCGQAHRKVNAC